MDLEHVLATNSVVAWAKKKRVGIFTGCDGKSVDAHNDKKDQLKEMQKGEAARSSGSLNVQI